MHPIILFAGFFFFAVAYNLLGPLATNIMATTGLSLSESGSLLSFQQIGSILSMAASLFLMKKFKQSTVAKIGYTFLMLALTAIALSTGRIALFACYLIMGMGTFLVDSGSNATLAGDYYEKRALYIPLLHFCYSAGAIITGYFILPFKGPSWPWAYGTVGIIMAVNLFVGIVEQRFKRKRSSEDSTKNPTPKQEIQSSPVMPLLTDRAFILYTLVILLYMGSQIICAAWIPVYIETELAQPASITATSLTVFWLGTAVSRLIIGPILKKAGKPYTLSILGLLFSGLSLAAATLFSNIFIVLAFVMLCGFFSGSTIPVYIVVTSTWYPKNTAFISLSYILAGTIGRMILPYLVTVLATVTTLGFSLRMSSLLLITSALLVVSVQKFTKTRASM